MNARTRDGRHAMRVRRRWSWIIPRAAEHTAISGPVKGHGPWCNVCNILATARALRDIQERGPDGDR